MLQEYQPDPADTRGLFIRRGETVMILSQDQNQMWYKVRNERNKEGYVPCTHLVAPYSTMRSRAKFPTGGPIRPVASGSSIDVMDPNSMPHVVPMYSCKSAGRPRNYSMGEDNRIHSNVNNSMANAPRRGYSPQDTSYNHSNVSTPQGHTPANPMNDQKYSPSTSSGVASFTGTGSPVGQSDGSNHSSFCSIEEVRGIEGTPIQNSIGEESSRMKGRATSDTNISHMKHTRSHLPPPPLPPSRDHTFPEVTRPLSDQPEGALYNSVCDDVPPPLPPRSLYYNLNPPPPKSASPADQYLPPTEECPLVLDESDPYAAPADAIPRIQSPHLGGQPRVRSMNDMRLRDVRLVQDNGVYSEVFQGYQRPHRQQNGYHVSPNGIVGEEIEYLPTPNSEGSSHSHSSKRSGSHVSSMRTQTTESYYNSHEIMMSHESDMTPNGERGVVGGENVHRPLVSANSIVHSGSTQIKTFRKNLWGLCIIIDKFEACDENEVSVREGDHVSVWNQDDPDWHWIVKHDTNEEGFVPSRCLKEIVSDSHNMANQGSKCKN